MAKGKAKEDTSEVVDTPIEFSIHHNGRKFVYDFDTLGIEQVELARELGEFKVNQMQAQPETFQSVVDSGGTDWLPVMMSFLYREEIDGVLKPFDMAAAKREVEPFIRKLPAKNIVQLRRVVQDFFQDIEMQAISSHLLQGTLKHAERRMWLALTKGIQNVG